MCIYGNNFLNEKENLEIITEKYWNNYMEIFKNYTEIWF